jgi:hypothetical protein
MKAQPLTTELLDELSGFEQSILLSEFKQRRYLFECDKAIRVDPAEGYMCKGIVYALSNDFDKMYESFKIAMRLAPSDDLIKTNFIATMSNFGRFEEMKEVFSIQTIADGSIRLETFFRALISTLELEILREVNSDYVERVEQALSSLNLELEDVKSCIFLFNNLMHQKKIRFGMLPSISWLVEDGDLFVYYDFVGTATESMEIMDEFDKLAKELGLRHIARKVTIVLMPLAVC